MKKLIILILLLTGISSFAQNKNAKVSLEVDGICMMCKTRIEKASLASKGVKFAVWDVKTHELKVIYDERKTNLKTISQTVANAGHDTKEVKATEEAYNTVHNCCRYRDESIQEEHKEGEEHKD